MSSCKQSILIPSQCLRTLRVIVREVEEEVEVKVEFGRHAFSYGLCSILLIIVIMNVSL